MKRTFTMLQILRDETAGPGNYTLAGLPEGKDFRKGSSYERFRASWLKVDGIGFATKWAEFSQYEGHIEVETKGEGQSAHIRLVLD